MKRMWHNCLALIAAVVVAGTANAQNDWNQPSTIGSYQSILARAGYGNQVGPMAQPMMQAGVPMQGSAMPAAVSQAMPMQGHAMPPAPTGAPAPMASFPSNPMQSAPVQMNPAPMMQPGTVVAQPQVSGTACSTCANGSAMMNGMIHGPVTYGNAAMGGYANAGCGTSAIYDGVVSNSVGQPVYSAECNTPVYESYAAPAITAPVAQAGSNYTVGIYGLLFQRDYEDNRYLASNPAGDRLFTNDADENNMDGYGLLLASRSCGGRGFEVGYWALNPGAVSYGISGAAVNTNIRGLDRLTHAPSGRNVYDIYTDNISQTIVRNTNINNLELNMLRNGGRFCFRGKRPGCYELLFGFRWFEFEEQLQYLAEADTVTYPLTPANFAYTLNARNRLLGLQLGARNEVCLGNRFSFFSGVKGGLYNNNIHTRQTIIGSDNVSAIVNTGASAGRVFDYSDSKNDVAFLGELDFGILMNLTCRSRLRLGYRAVGVGGVALAADQIPHDFSDADELLRANSNGNLLLSGGYYGLEFCF